MLKGRPTTTTTPTLPARTFSRESSSAPNIAESHGAFLRFLPGDGRQFGFPFAQLMEFVLDANPDGDPDAPQRLLLAFSTHDVTVTGCRLDLLCEQLDQRQPIRLKAEDPRFANFNPDVPFVVGISIKAVSTS